MTQDLLAMFDLATAQFADRLDDGPPCIDWLMRGVDIELLSSLHVTAHEALRKRSYATAASALLQLCGLERVPLGNSHTWRRLYWLVRQQIHTRRASTAPESAMWTHADAMQHSSEERLSGVA